MANIAIFSEIQEASSLKFLAPHPKYTCVQERSVGPESGPKGYDAQVKNTYAIRGGQSRISQS